MPKIIGDGSEYGYTKEEWESFSRSTRYRIRNPDIMKKATASWYNKNKNYVKLKAREYQLRDKYKISTEQYQILLATQNYRCAICEIDKPTGKWSVFAVDHCHETGEVRGLLCNECNRGMGLLKDSELIVEKTLNYLRNHKKKTKEESLTGQKDHK